MELIDSSERADTLLSKRTGVGFEPVTSWLRTRGTNHYAIAALSLTELLSGEGCEPPVPYVGMGLMMNFAIFI